MRSLKAGANEYNEGRKTERGRPMNVCMWTGSSFEQPYASYHLMEGVLKALLNAGHQVWLVQMRRLTGEMPASLTGKEGLHVIEIPWSEPKKAAFAKRYLKAIAYYKACEKQIREIPGLDAVFLQSNIVAYFPVTFCRRRKLPVVFNVQDIFPMDALVTGMLKASHPAYIVSRWMQKTAYRKANRVVTISEDMKKTLMGEGRKDVDVIYNWSYQNEPYHIADADNHFLNTYGIRRSDGFRVVYAGNIGKMMDADTLIRTAVCLKEYPDIKFYIIGTGSNLNYLKQKAEESKLETLLFFPPQPMEYAPDNYCMADVNINPVPKGVMFTCMPSKTNTCLLSRKPTVAAMDADSDMAGRLRKVDQWTVVPAGDAEAMARAILEQYQRGNWNVRSRNAAEFMRNLGPVENAAQYVRILEETVHGTTGR